MDPTEAVDLIRPAVDPGSATWADLGAGRGTFTRALASILGRGSRVLAVDRDRRAVRALQRLAGGPPGEAQVVAIRGDFHRLDQLPQFSGIELDGVLFANALHFASDVTSILLQAARHLRSEGRLVVIEYDGASPSRWVPHPLPEDRLQKVAPRAGFTEPRVVARRQAAYRGAMYCAVCTRPP